MFKTSHEHWLSGLKNSGYTRTVSELNKGYPLKPMKEKTEQKLTNNTHQNYQLYKKYCVKVSRRTIQLFRKFE